MDSQTRENRARRLARQLELHVSGARRLSRSEIARCRREIAECDAALKADLAAAQTELDRRLADSRLFTPWWQARPRQLS